MKKLFVFLFVAAAFLGLSVSCNDIPESVEKQGPASLTLTVSQGVPATKADPSTVARDYESQVNKLDFFFFEGGTTLYRHETVTSPSFSGGSFTKTFENLPVGSYVVAVVANAPEGVASLNTLDAVKGKAVTLANCSRTASVGFSMFFISDMFELSAGENDLSDTPFMLTRFPSRVRLLSVGNTIPSASAFSNDNSVKVKGIFLCRTNSAWTLGGSGSATALVNPTSGEGAVQSIPSAQKSFVPTIPGYPAQTSWFPELVTIANGSTNASLNWDVYGFATPSSSTSPIKLEILAEVNGENWYYPVVLPAGIGRNKTYEVLVTISGPGTKDVTVDKLERAHVSAQVQVTDWETGGQYTENI